MKDKKIKKSSLLTVLLAVLGVCLLLVGGIGGARAALTESDYYTAEMQTPTIAVELYENDSKQAVKDGSTELLKERFKTETLVPGKVYDETLTVKNSGTAEAFVRITIYKYWTATSEDGTVKRVDLEPDYIHLTFGSEWLVDEDASTEERTILYYPTALAVGETTEPALTKIAASSELSTLVTQKQEKIDDTHIKITSTYQYDGLNLNLEASVDAIQVHNAKDAIIAAWGVTNVTADEDGNLSLK